MNGYHRDYIFYQFGLDAKSRMAHRDFMAALLYSVIALEGAHAAVLQVYLKRRVSLQLTDCEKCDKCVEEKANKLLMEVGFSAMLEMTSLLFLDKEDQVSPDDIKECQRGITIRNEIMHSLSRRGQYKFRNRRVNDINTAYTAVMKVYSHFVKVIERTGNGT